MPKITTYLAGEEPYGQRIGEFILSAPRSTQVIYVTLSRPHTYVAEILTFAGVNTDRILFIDAISAYVGSWKKGQEVPNCVFISSPSDITSVGIAINAALKKIQGRKILVFDSFSTLMVYADGNVAGRFANFLTKRLRNLGADGVLIALESDSQTDAVKVLKAYSDEVKT